MPDGLRKVLSFASKIDLSLQPSTCPRTFHKQVINSNLAVSGISEVLRFHTAEFSGDSRRILSLGSTNTRSSIPQACAILSARTPFPEPISRRERAPRAWTAMMFSTFLRYSLRDSRREL